MSEYEGKHRSGKVWPLVARYTGLHAQTEEAGTEEETAAA